MPQVGTQKEDKNRGFKTNYYIMHVKVLQNAQREHSAIHLSIIKLQLSLRPLFCLF